MEKDVEDMTDEEFHQYKLDRIDERIEKLDHLIDESGMVVSVLLGVPIFIAVVVLFLVCLAAMR